MNDSNPLLGNLPRTRLTSRWKNLHVPFDNLLVGTNDDDQASVITAFSAASIERDPPLSDVFLVLSHSRTVPVCPCAPVSVLVGDHFMIQFLSHHFPIRFSSFLSQAGRVSAREWYKM